MVQLCLTAILDFIYGSKHLGPCRQEGGLSGEGSDVLWALVAFALYVNSRSTSLLRLQVARHAKSIL